MSPPCSSADDQNPPAYKYFTQFVTYATCFLATCLATGVHSLRRQKQDPPPAGVDKNVYAIVGLSSFFTLFTLLMVITAVRLIIMNSTNIDSVQRDKVLLLAVRVPLDTPSSVAQ